VSKFTNFPRKFALAASVAVLVVTAGAIPLTSALADNDNQNWKHPNQSQRDNHDNNGYRHDDQHYYQQPRVYYQEQAPVYYAPQPGTGLQINIQ
jgi:hypothetical protein